KIQQDYLSTIALNTGGRALINQSSLTRAVEQIVGENGSYYLLGYYPDPIAHDGKFHDIKVRVTRDDVRVRARPGYLAGAATPGPVDGQHALNAALASGTNGSGLLLRAFAAPIAATAKGMTTLVTVELTYPNTPGDAPRPINDV